MFTPTPSSPAVTGASTSSDLEARREWHIVEVELLTGPNGRAAVAWMAAEKPLRMQWRVGRRIFKSVEAARAYAKSIVATDLEQ